MFPLWSVSRAPAPLGTAKWEQTNVQIGTGYQQMAEHHAASKRGEFDPFMSLSTDRRKQ